MGVAHALKTIAHRGGLLLKKLYGVTKSAKDGSGRPDKFKRDQPISRMHARCR
jgi:hypothetical protein